MATHTDDTDTRCRSCCLYAAVHAAVLTGHKGTCYGSSCKQDEPTKKVLRGPCIHCTRVQFQLAASNTSSILDHFHCIILATFFEFPRFLCKHRLRLFQGGSPVLKSETLWPVVSVIVKDLYRYLSRLRVALNDIFK